MRFLVVLIPSLLQLLSLLEFASGAGSTHGASASASTIAEQQRPAERTSIARLRRRRKTPLELIQVETNVDTRRGAATPSYKKNSETSVALDIEAPNKGPSSFVVQKDDEDTKDPSDNNRGIIGQKAENSKDYLVVEKLNYRNKKNELAAIDEASAVMKMMRMLDNGSSMSMSMSIDESAVTTSFQNSMRMLLDEEEEEYSAVMRDAMLYYNSFSMDSGSSEQQQQKQKQTRNFVFPDQNELIRAYSNMVSPSMSMDAETTNDVQMAMMQLEIAFSDHELMQAEIRMMSMSMPPAESQVAAVTTMDGTGYVPVTVSTVNNDGPPNSIKNDNGNDIDIDNGHEHAAAPAASVPTTSTEGAVVAVAISDEEPGSAATDASSPDMVVSAITAGVTTPTTVPAENGDGDGDGGDSSKPDTVSVDSNSSPQPVSLGTSAPTKIGVVVTADDDKEKINATTTTNDDDEDEDEDDGTAPKAENAAEISAAEDGATSTATTTTDNCPFFVAVFNACVVVIVGTSFL